MRATPAALPGSDALGPLYEGGLAAALLALQRNDREALHDYRVALRRLRVQVKQFAQPGGVRRKILRALARLLEKSNQQRDAEVMLAWLATQSPRLDELERIGASEWRRALERQQRHARPRPKQNAAALRQLVTPLSSLRPLEGFAHLALGQLAAQRVEEQAQRLFAVMNSRMAPMQLHHLRLRVKSVRYLLLPFCQAADCCAQADEVLHQLQERLGEWHDALLRQQNLTAQLRKAMAAHAHKLEQAVKRRGAMAAHELSPRLPGLLALARSNAAIQQRVECLIARDYLHDGAARLAPLLQQAAAELRRGEADRLP